MTQRTTKRIRVKSSELKYPKALRSGRRFAPLPDLVTYWKCVGGYMNRWWKFGRGRCAGCQQMFTLGKDIRYRGFSYEENLLCDPCAGTEDPERIRRIKQRRPQ